MSNTPVVTAQWNVNFFFECYDDIAKKLYYQRKSNMIKYAPADKLLQPHVGNDSSVCAAITTIPLLQPEWVTVPCEKPLFNEWVCQKEQEDISGIAVCETRRSLPDCAANLTMVDGNCLLVILSSHTKNINDCHRNLIVRTFVLCTQKPCWHHKNISGC